MDVDLVVGHAGSFETEPIEIDIEVSLSASAIVAVSAIVVVSAVVVVATICPEFSLFSASFRRGLGEKLWAIVELLINDLFMCELPGTEHDLRRLAR